MLKRGGRWQALEGLLSGAPISEAQEEASRHRAAGLAHAAPGTVDDVLAALEPGGIRRDTRARILLRGRCRIVRSPRIAIAN